MQKMLRLILTSKVYEAAVETPLDKASGLSRELGNNIFLKREDLQPVFSFKLRGAYNKISQLPPEQLQRGVIAASAGNHAQGVAFSARQAGIPALIVMPETTPAIKVDAVRRLGGEVVLHGDSFSDAAQYCQQLIAEKGMTFIHPFDDELVIAGQGTVGDELLRQSAGRLDAVFVPVGGGGLLAGIAAYIKTLAPQIRVVGVEPEDSAAMTQSLAVGKRQALDTVGIFADGVAVKDVGKLTYAYCRRFVDDTVLVSTDEICSAIKAIYSDTRSIVEPAGALAVAGLRRYCHNHNLQGQRLAAINSGANMNFERLQFVAERTRIGEEKEALYAVTIPETPGSLQHFYQKVVAGNNITEFNYRLSDRQQAHIFVGIGVEGRQQRQAFARQLEQEGFSYLDLTDDDLAKTHLRHMVGGRSSQVHQEVLYRFWFPERPGALGQFLESMGSNWNISLFHYRSQGGDYGRVLIGLELPEGSEKTFERFLKELGYRYLAETNNPVYHLFL